MRYRIEIFILNSNKMNVSTLALKVKERHKEILRSLHAIKVSNDILPHLPACPSNQNLEV